MLKSVLCSFLMSLLLTGCLSLSQRQQQALQAVVDFFGGQVQYKMGVVASTEASKKNMTGPYAELEIKNSPVIAKFQQLEMPASYAASLFYNALGEAESQQYACIRVTILGENSTNTYNFSTFDLHVVREAAPQIAQVVAALKSQRYAQLEASASPEAFSDTTRGQLKTIFTKSDTKFGRTLSYQPYGFRLSQDTVKGRPVLLLRTFGQLKKEKSAGGFCIVTEPGVPATEKYLFGFEAY